MTSCLHETRTFVDDMAAVSVTLLSYAADSATARTAS